MKKHLTTKKPSTPKKAVALRAAWVVITLLLAACACEDTALPGPATVQNKTEQTYTVSYVTNNGAVWKSESVVSGGRAAQPIAPRREGHAFVAWHSNAGLGGAFDFTTAITSNTRLYAQWRSGTGNGPAFSRPWDIAIHNGAAYVTDDRLGAVVRVDLSTGDRTYFSKSGTRGSGPGFAWIHGIAFYNGAVYVTDEYYWAVFKVDLSTGDRTYFSKSGTRGSGTRGSGTRGSGPAFGGPFGIAFHNGATYVADRSLNAVFKVDLPTGDRTIISGRVSDRVTNGTGPAFNEPFDIAFYNGVAYVTDSHHPDYGNFDVVFKVDLSTGNRTILSGRVSEGVTNGSGPAFSESLFSIAFYNGAAYVTSFRRLRALFKVDLSTGDRTIVSKGGTYQPELNRGRGPDITLPFGIAFYNGVAYVSGFHEIVKVDLATGDRAIVSQ